MPRPTEAVRVALPIWAAWLVAVVGVVALLVASGLIASEPATGMPGVVRDGLLWPLRSWDAAWYGRIARAGYPDDGGREWAFFPLWPLLLRLGPDSVVGGALAVLASAAAFAGVIAAREPAEPAAARRTAVALAALPGSFALLLLYPDALALACAAWSTVAVRRGARGQAAAAALAAAAAFLRPNGFLIALPLAWLAWRHGGRGRLLAAAAPLAALAVWLGYGEAATGGFAFGEAQSAWGRGHGPWHLATQLADVASTGHVQTLVEAAIAVLALGLLIALRAQRQGVGWVVFAAAVLLVSLGSGSFQSIGRQALYAFPLVWAAADARALRDRRAVALGVAANVGLIAALPLLAP